MSTLFKKSLISTAFIFLSAGAIAEEISNDTIYLKWGGVAPKSSTYDSDKGFCINGGENPVDPAAGKLTITRNKEDNTKVDIESSTVFHIYLNPYNNNKCNKKITMPFKYKNERFKVVITDENGVRQKVNKDKWELSYAFDFDLTSTTSTGYMDSKSLNAINEFDKVHSDLIGMHFWVSGKKLDVGSGVWAEVRAYLLIEPVQT